MFVEATPINGLQKNTERIIKETELRVKIIDITSTRLKGYANPISSTRIHVLMPQFVTCVKLRKN